MIFFWIIQAIRKIIWLFRLPKPESLAKADSNEPCPCCGYRIGIMRCVLLPKPGPIVEGKALPTMILRQHACQVCGAMWHHETIRKVTVNDVLPAPPRNEMEKAADRWMKSLQENPTP